MSTAAPNIVSLPLEKIYEERDFNIRIFYGDIDDLAIRLMTEGQLEAIKVRKRDNQYFVTHGHRRRAAFLRAHELRIERGPDNKWWVVEGKGDNERKIAEAKGPLHRNFNPQRIACQIEEKDVSDREVFLNQISYGSGLGYSSLEKLLFIGKLRKRFGMSKEEIQAECGFSRTHVNNAESLNSADPRLLRFVSEGKISQKIALRLLRTCSAAEQMSQIQKAFAAARKRGRDEKVLPKDFKWKEDPSSQRSPGRTAVRKDPVRQRLRGLMGKFGPQIKRPPTQVAKERLNLLGLLDRYLSGKASYAEVEAYVLGRA